MKRNPRLGSTLDDLLREDGALEDVEARAQKRVLARQLEQLMRQQAVTKAALAARMGTSRSALDRLLDPTNASVTLYTIASAARALGAQLDLRLSRRRSNQTVPVRRSGRAVPASS
ncbi:MAG: helix-turn-helix domain-containing protein [Mycobacterium sp.]